MIKINWWKLSKSFCWNSLQSHLLWTISRQLSHPLGTILSSPGSQQRPDSLLHFWSWPGQCVSPCRKTLLLPRSSILYIVCSLQVWGLIAAHGQEEGRAAGRQSCRCSSSCFYWRTSRYLQSHSISCLMFMSKKYATNLDGKEKCWNLPCQWFTTFSLSSAPQKICYNLFF